MSLLCFDIQKSVRFKKSYQTAHRRQRVCNYTSYCCGHCLALFLIWVFCLFVCLINRFPCTVGDCTKEYRTRWELNSHQRQKHAKPVTTNESIGESGQTMYTSVVTESPKSMTNTLNISHETPAKRHKTANDENIIYILSEEVSNFCD